MSKVTRYLPNYTARIALLALVAVPAAGLGLALTSQPAAAASCSTIPGCTKGSTAANKFASTTVSAALTAYRMLVETYLTMLSDSLTRLANQGSNNVQNFTKTQTSLTDKFISQTVASANGAARVQAAFEAIPSRTACRTASNANRLNVSTLSTARVAAYDATQRDATDYAANAPGTPGNRGSIAATNANFLDMMNGFCDTNIMKEPSGISCTIANDRDGIPMAFRYTQPFLAVFGVKDNTIPPAATDGENRAARLFVRMATEPVPVDPIRGNVLQREEGKNAFLRRQSDIAVINLARGALDRLVDDRIGTLSPGSESVALLRQRAWADANGMAKDAIDRASQPTAANMDDLAPLIADINKIYLQIFNNFERLAAMKATNLARVVGESQTGSASVSTRTIGN